MDSIVNGTLVGSINGVVLGNAALVAGRRGRALHTNGRDQWVDLGNHRDKCFGNLLICRHGFVLAVWLKAHIHTNQWNNVEFYYSSGGHNQRSMGVALLQTGHKLVSYCRTAEHIWYTPGADFSAGVWHHVTLTWEHMQGLHLYLNGCVAAEDKTAFLGNYDSTLPKAENFYLGRQSPLLGNNPGEMTMDELYMWDARMDQDDVWNIYVKALDNSDLLH